MRKPETMRFRAATTVAQKSVPREADCRQLAQKIIADWKSGAEVDATAALKQHPHLGRYKSVVLDLAYEEYCMRTERGEAVSTSRFCQRFPDYQRSVLEQIKVAHLLSKDGGFLEDLVTAIWPQPGDELVGYEIVDELGRGAFARVYLATETALGGRQVAIKVSRHGTAKAEAEMLGKLDHDNIVPVHSVQKDEATGLTVICMPYLGRATLCDALDAAICEAGMPRKAATILEAVREVNGDDVGRNGANGAHRFLRSGSYVDGVLHLGTQLADALSYAHSVGKNGILHLDLKPSNVLVTSDGTPMLLDFNLSTEEQNGEQPLGGTLPYMSPEQLRRFSSSGRNGAEIDHRSDVFSLGVILYELLCGELPCGEIPDGLETKELADYLMKRGGARPLRSMNATIDHRVAGVIDRCLASDPRDRPQTAGELAADLRRELSVNQRARRQARSHPIVAAVIAVMVFALIGSTAAFFALRDPYDVRQFKAGIQAFEQHNNNLALEHLNNSIKAQPTIQAYFARAQVFASMAETDAAIRDLDAARALGGDESQFNQFARGQYELGRDAFEKGEFEKGEYDTALHLLKISVAADTSSAEALFLRGRTFAKLDDPDFAAAAHDVEKSLNIEPHRQRMAFLGYCWNMAMQHRTAIHWYELAIKEGLQSPAVYNNLGFSHLRMKRRTSAVAPLSKATRIDDHCQAAFHNLALVHLELARLAGEEPKKALQDIRAAIACANPTGELYLDAARVCAYGASSNPKLRQSAVDYLRNAIEQGADRQVLRSDPFFSPIETDVGEIQAQSIVDNYKATFLIDPLSSESDSPSF